MLRNIQPSVHFSILLDITYVISGFRRDVIEIFAVM